MKVKIAGTLFWQNHSYLLVDAHPMIDREHWMKDQDEAFLVCTEGGRIFTFIASRPFAISRLRMGEMVEVKSDVKEAEEENKYEELFQRMTV